MIREEIALLIEKSIKELQKGKVFPQFGIPEIQVERPEEKVHGDYVTNVAMVIAKIAKKRPMEIAELIKSKVKNLPPTETKLLVRGQKAKVFDEVKVAHPGFINFFLSREYLQKQVLEILKQKEKFGELKIGKKQKVNVEFISANPTGPLTLGNGRGGFCGDVLANILRKVGYKTTREYYINDVGEQVRKLGHSVLGDSEAVYKGDYIKEVKKIIKGKNSKKVGEAAAKVIFKKMIKPSVKKMGINFDVWFSEKSLYENKEVDKILDWLKKKKLVYQKEDALWLKSTQFGDDKDRVLVKTDGEKTYIASDIAYLKNKFKRGFNKLIYFWGADHYGYIGRMKAAVKALGYKKEQADFIIMQLVRLFEKGKEVRMAKRTGAYVTLDELIDEVGLDVARFFFLTRSPGSHLNFDLSLAKEQSQKNPVFYVQYAHARICAILRKSGKYEIRSTKKRRKKSSDIQTSDFRLFIHPSELGLIKQLIKFPEVIEDTAKDYQVQRLPQYALDLATSFHQFYRDCRVIPAPYRTKSSGAGSGNKELTQARLGLILAAKIVLKSTLNLMGISAPEKM